VTASRQDRLGGDGPPLYTTPRGRRMWSESDEPAAEALPAHLRSTTGRNALPETPWPIGWDATVTIGIAWQTLFALATHIATRTGAAVRLPLLEYFDAHLQSMASDPEAADWLDDLTHLREQCLAQIDHADPDVYAGPCTSRDVRVIQSKFHGPACDPFTGGCQHSSCASVRLGEEQLIPRIVACGADLYGRLADQEIKCVRCGHTYPIAERQQELLGMAPDVLARVVPIADGISALRRTHVTPSMIRNLEQRGEIRARGYDANGGKLFRVGDVLNVLDQRAARKADRAASRRIKQDA